MSTRWWIFLIVLWTITLLVAMPFLCSLTREFHPGTRADNHDALQVYYVKTVPLLDWTGVRLARYEVEVDQGDEVARYPLAEDNFSVDLSQPDAVQIKYPRSGAVLRIPRRPAAIPEKPAIQK